MIQDFWGDSHAALAPGGVNHLGLGANGIWK